MSKKVLARVAAAVLTTGLLTTGLVAGSSGPANAAFEHHHRLPVATSTGDASDPGVLVTPSFASDTGWG